MTLLHVYHFATCLSLCYMFITLLHVYHFATCLSLFYIIMDSSSSYIYLYSTIQGHFKASSIQPVAHT